MRKANTMSFIPFTLGFLVSNLFAAIAIMLASRDLAIIQSQEALSHLSLNTILIAAGPCSIIGGIVSAYCERISARRHGYKERAYQLAAIVILSHAVFVIIVTQAFIRL